jgi:hypothetical protein
MAVMEKKVQDMAADLKALNSAADRRVSAANNNNG